MKFVSDILVFLLKEVLFFLMKAFRENFWGPVLKLAIPKYGQSLLQYQFSFVMTQRERAASQVQMPGATAFWALELTYMPMWPTG